MGGWATPEQRSAAFATSVTSMGENSDMAVPSVALKSNDEDVKIRIENSFAKTTI